MKTFLLFLIFCSTAFATSFMQRDFGEFVHSTSHIVRGKVGRVWSDWVEMPNGSKQIYTFTEIRVDEAVKGNFENKVIKVREIGGEKDGVNFSVSGTAEFSAGEDVVLMLRDTGAESSADHSFQISDMMMGKLNVEKQQDGTEILSGPALSLDEHPHLRPSDENKAPVENKKWSMDDLRKIAKERPTPSASLLPNGESGSLKLLSGQAVTRKNGDSAEEQNPETAGDTSKNRLFYYLIPLLALALLVWFKRR